MNQSLDAEIPLVLSGADSLNEVKVGLAGPEAFAKAGVERHYFLTKLQFSAVQSPNGSYIIKVSSREVMREPFLSFLMEVNWPQGRMLREFTVLLDPPSTLPEETVAETAPPVAERPIRHFERIAETDRSAGAAPPARQSAQRSVTLSPQQALAPSAPATPPSEDQLTNDAYGPIHRDENLWGIAKAIKGDSSFTHEQIIMALYRANPQAFARSVNTLKAGSTLRIPTRGFIAQLDPQQARIEFARQQGWNVERFIASRDPEPAASAGGEAPQGQLRLAPPSEANSKNQGAVTGNEMGGGKAKGDLALEVAETAKQENEEFRSRLAQLEQKLGDMQRMLSLKDEQIASLQAQQRGTPQPAAEAPQAPAVQPGTPAIRSAPPAQPPASVQQPSVPSPTPSADQVQPPSAAPKPPETSAPPAPATKPSPPVIEESEGSIDSTYLILAGGALTFGLVAWLIQRRRQAMIEETESILLAAERESLYAAQKPAAKAMGSAIEPAVSPRSSFLSEFTPSDFDALGTEADDVDPISEADVYLAYGRYKQAEELIRNAIAQHPERHEYKLKLLEIYYVTENRAVFQNYAQELKAQNMDAQPGFWAKVEEMGRELAPDSPLFRTASPREKKTAGQDFNLSKSLGSLDLSDDLIDDLKRFEIEFADPASAGDTDLVMLDPDVEPESAAIQAERASEADRFAPLDFDSASLHIDKRTPLGSGAKPEQIPELENLISFDFGKPPSRPEAKSAPVQSEPSIDDILRDLDRSTNRDKAEPTPEIDSATSDGNLGTLEFDLSLFESDLVSALEEESQAEGDPDDDEGDLYAGLTDMDQIETKLDLAKAYADMDDEDAAVEMLTEVLAKGNDSQKSEARSLLDKMGKLDPQLEFSIPEPRSRRM